MTSQEPQQILQTFGANVADARRRAGLTQRALAIFLDVDTLAISRWERGKANPTTSNLVALAAALGEDPGWFYADHPETREAA